MRYYSHIQGNLFKQLLARSTAVALRKNYLYRVDLDTTTKLSITFSASTRSAPIPLLMPIHCVRSLIHVSVTKLLPFHRSTTFFSHFSSTTHLMQGQSYMYDPPSARPHPSHCPPPPPQWPVQQHGPSCPVPRRPRRCPTWRSASSEPVRCTSST